MPQWEVPHTKVEQARQTVDLLHKERSLGWILGKPSVLKKPLPIKTANLLYTRNIKRKMRFSFDILSFFCTFAGILRIIFSLNYS